MDFDVSIAPGFRLAALLKGVNLHSLHVAMQWLLAGSGMPQLSYIWEEFSNLDIECVCDPN